MKSLHEVTRETRTLPDRVSKKLAWGWIVEVRSTTELLRFKSDSSTTRKPSRGRLQIESLTDCELVMTVLAILLMFHASSLKVQFRIPYENPFSAWHWLWHRP